MSQSALIESLAHEAKRVPQTAKDDPSATQRSYMDDWQHSISDPSTYWLEQSKRLEWIRAPERSLEYEWNTAKRIVRHACFEDWALNASANCLDRHCANERADKRAIIWQGETRSVEIMEEQKEKIAEGNTDDLGDVTTLADSGVIGEIVKRLQGIRES